MILNADHVSFKYGKREEVRRKRLKSSRGYSDEKIDSIFASQLKEAERLEKEKERLEAEEKEATEGKNDESDAMNGNQRANR